MPISSLVVLLPGVLWCAHFLLWLNNLDISPFTWTDCKLTYFCWYFSHHFSSGLLVIMSVEKFFALYFPLKTKTVCTVKTAKRVTIVAAVVFAAFDSQFFFIMEKHEDNNCKFTKVSKTYSMTLNRIDATLYSFAPFAIIGLLNLAIIYKFVKAKLESVQASKTESTNQALSMSAMRGTTILITVSIMFILLTGPGEIMSSITHYPHPPVKAVVYISTCVNHSINAVLYCIVGSRFRQEVLKILCCRKVNLHRNTEVENSVNSSHSTITTAASSI